MATVSNSSVKVLNAPLLQANVGDSILAVTNPTSNNEAEFCRFTIDTLFQNTNMVIPNGTPANSSANAMLFSLSADSNYIYVCVGNNIIKRVALQSF